MNLRNLFKFREQEVSDVKPFLDHLEDLRWMFIKMAVALAVGMVFSFLYRAPLLKALQWPLASVDPSLPAKLQSFGPADSFTISFQLAFYAGIVLTFPFLLYFLAEFTLPALNKKEKKMVLPGVVAALILFLTGVFFCFFLVLPAALKFLFGDSRNLGWNPNWSVREYFAFISQISLAFGLSFELPVVVLALVKVGLLNHKILRSTRPYAIVIISGVAAVITPTGDLLTVNLMILPMLVLYEACIWIAKFMEKKPNEPAHEDSR